MAKNKGTKPQDLPSPSMDPEDGSEKDYTANNAFRNIVDAESHKADPALMARVAKVAQRHSDAATGVIKMTSVADIKAHAKKAYPVPKRYEAK